MSSLDTARTKSIPDTQGPLRKSCGSVAYFHVFPYVYVGKHVGKHVCICISHLINIAWGGHLIPYDDKLKFISHIVQRGGTFDPF